jgi:hypothetical protein
MQVIDMLWDNIWLLGIYERPPRTCNPAHEFWSGNLTSPSGSCQSVPPNSLLLDSAQIGFGPDALPSPFARLASIVLVKAARKSLRYFRALVFVDGQAHSGWIPERITRPIRNLEGTALWRPATST